MRRLLAALLVLALVSPPVLANDDAAPPGWPPAPELDAFVNKVLDTDWRMNLCSYAFADGAHDGTLRLIAALDVNGRHACNRLVVIEKRGSDFKTLDDLQVWQEDDVKAALRNLDGRRALIVTQAWSPFDGSHCTATFGKVYAWRGGRYADASADFSDFYRDRLKELAAQPPARDDSCRQMEMDKIDRLLGTPNAGFDRAGTWMKSSESALRRKAAAVLADIGDENSKKELSALAGDDDPLVAETARHYIESPAPKE